MLSQLSNLLGLSLSVSGADARPGQKPAVDFATLFAEAEAEERPQAGNTAVLQDVEDMTEPPVEGGPEVDDAADAPGLVDAPAARPEQDRTLRTTVGHGRTGATGDGSDAVPSILTAAENPSRPALLDGATQVQGPLAWGASDGFPASPSGPRTVVEAAPAQPRAEIDGTWAAKRGSGPVEMLDKRGLAALPVSDASGQRRAGISEPARMVPQQGAGRDSARSADSVSRMPIFHLQSRGFAAQTEGWPGAETGTRPRGAEPTNAVSAPRGRPVNSEAAVPPPVSVPAQPGHAVWTGAAGDRSIATGAARDPNQASRNLLKMADGLPAMLAGVASLEKVHAPAEAGQKPETRSQQGPAGRPTASVAAGQRIAPDAFARFEAVVSASAQAASAGRKAPEVSGQVHPVGHGPSPQTLAVSTIAPSDPAGVPDGIPAMVRAVPESPLFQEGFPRDSARVDFRTVRGSEVQPDAAGHGGDKPAPFPQAAPPLAAAVPGLPQASGPSFLARVTSPVLADLLDDLSSGGPLTGPGAPEVRASSSGLSFQAVDLGRADPQPVLRQIAEAVARMRDGGVEIQLSPEELGRVRMQMVSGEGGLTVHITADRPETLDLMRRNIDQLARDLADAGYGGAEFTFGSSGKDGGKEDSPPRGTSPDASAQDPTERPVRDRPYQQTPVHNGLDIRI